MSESVQPSPDSVVNMERRGAPRSDLQSRPLAVIVPDEGGEAVDVLGRNLSATGLMFVCLRAIPVGRRVEIHMIGAQGRKEHVTGRVVRCEPLSGSCHEVAVQFDAPIEPVWFLCGGHLPA